MPNLYGKILDMFDNARKREDIRYFVPHQTFLNEIYGFVYGVLCSVTRKFLWANSVVTLIRDAVAQDNGLHVYGVKLFKRAIVIKPGKMRRGYLPLRHQLVSHACGKALTSLRHALLRVFAEYE